MSRELLDGKRILIVDDEEDLREVIRERFEMEGCSVEVAANGKLAAEKIRTQRFDVIISDIRMPGMSGLDLLKFVQSQSSGTATAVILISGFADVDRRQVLSQGASNLLVKPFDLDDVIQAVCQIFQSKKP